MTKSLTECGHSVVNLFAGAITSTAGTTRLKPQARDRKRYADNSNDERGRDEMDEDVHTKPATPQDVHSSSFTYLNDADSRVAACKNRQIMKSQTVRGTSSKLLSRSGGVYKSKGLDDQDA